MRESEGVEHVYTVPGIVSHYEYDQDVTNDNGDQIKQARKWVLDLAPEGDEDYHDDGFDEKDHSNVGDHDNALLSDNVGNDHSNIDDQVKQAFDLLIF